MKNITPLQAIRKKCIDCCGYQYNEVKACPVLDCPIWKFRLGLHPFTKKNAENPFLRKSFFVGLGDKSAKEVIKIISNMGGGKNGRRTRKDI